MLSLPCIQLALGSIPLLVCSLQLLLHPVQLCLLLLHFTAQMLYVVHVSSSGSSMLFCSLLMLLLSVRCFILHQDFSTSEKSLKHTSTCP